MRNIWLIVCLIATQAIAQFNFSDLPFMAGASFPPQPSDLKVWYRAEDYSAQADGFAVTNINDRSGHGNHATNVIAKAPLLTNGVLNGKAAFLFPGALTDRFGIITNAFGTNLVAAELFAVMRSGKSPADVAGSAPWRLQAAGGLGNSAHPYSDTAIYESCASYQQLAFVPIPHSQVASNWHIYHVVTQTNEMQMRYNGELIGGMDVVTPGMTNSPWFGKSSTDAYYGEIAEFMIYTKALTIAGRESVHAYLTREYGLDHTNAYLRFPPKSFSGLEAWWKADSLSLNDGDLISTWTDSSGSGRDVTNGAASVTPPVYKTNIFGGYPAVRFAGHLTNFLAMSSAPLTNYATFTAIVVARYTNDNATVLANGAGSSQLRVRSSAINRNLTFNGSSATSATYPRPIGDLRVDVFGRAGGNVYKHFQNMTNGAPGASTISGNIVLSQIGGINGALLGGDVAEIIIYTNSLAFDELTKLYYTYLKPKYALP